MKKFEELLGDHILFSRKAFPNSTKESSLEGVKKEIEVWNLGFCLGNTVKYILRSGKKDLTKYLEDLKKAAWYLNREIENLEKIQK